MTNSKSKFPEYTAVLSGTDGHYMLYVRELGILATGPDVAAAHRNLEVKKRKIFDEFANAGIADELPPSTVAKTDAVNSQHKNFIIRTLIVTVAALLVVGSTMYGARSIITASIDAVKIKPGEIHLKLLENKLVATLNAAADPRNDYSAEGRDRLIESLRTIVKRYKPFVDEVRPLISCNTDTITSRPAQGN